MTHRWSYLGRVAVLAFALAMPAAYVWAENPLNPTAPAPSTSPEPAPIAVSAEDALWWERYQLLSRLAAAQLDTLRLQNEKTLAEEYTKLNQRFLDHYKIPVDHLERRGDQWVPRQLAPPPTAK